MSARLLVCALALGALGCEGARRAADPSREVADDVAEHVAEDIAQPDAPDVEHAISRTNKGYSPAEVGLCDGTPADLRGATLWVDARGLWMAPHEHASSSDARLISAIGRDESPRSPVVLPQLEQGFGEVAFAVQGVDRCTLRILERDGALVSESGVEASRCTNPSPRSGYLVWPLGVAPATEGALEGGRLAWVDYGGRELSSLDLGAAPLTPAVSFGRTRLAGGGSHWLVGTSRGVIAVYDAISDTKIAMDIELTPQGVPKIAGTWEDPLGRVTGILVVGDYALVTIADPSEAGLGSYMRVLSLDFYGDHQVSLEAVAAQPIAVPGPIGAHPVALTCDVESGGWFCDHGLGGMVVAGGAGWLGAWRVPSGTPLYLHESEMSWTGLSLGRGGWVMGGGSHWRPNEPGLAARWRLIGVGPPPANDELVLASGDGEACVPSTLWDTNGDVAAPILGNDEVSFVRAALSGVEGDLGPGVGMARPLGNARNAGQPQAAFDLCQDLQRRGLAAVGFADHEIHGIVRLGRRTAVYGSRFERGLIFVLPEGTAAGVEINVMNAIGFDSAIADGDILVIPYFNVPTDGSARLGGFSQAPVPLWSHALSGDLGALIGVVKGAPGTYFVGSRQGSQDTVTRVREGFGEEVARSFGPGEPFGLERLLSDGAGGVMMVMALLENGAPGPVRLVIRHLDAELAEVGTVSWQRAAHWPLVVDATADAAGIVRVLIEVWHPTLGTSEPRLIVYDRDLALLDDRGMPYVGELATRPDGTSLIQTATGLARLAPNGAVGILRPAGDDDFGALNAALRGVAPSEQGFVAAFWRATLGGRELVWGDSDLIGLQGCAEAGLCVGVDASSCDVDVACTAGGCAPDTGLCVTEQPRPCTP